MLGISKRLLQSCRDRGIIGYSYIGRKIYYRRQDIDKLILLHTNIQILELGRAMVQYGILLYLLALL